jgi:hypothetical protein
MAKTIFRIGNDNDIFANLKLRQLPRAANGIKNMNYDENGNLCKRSGYVKFNTNILAEFPITGLHRFYTQGAVDKYTLAACGTKIYTLTDAAGHAGTELITGLTSGADTFFCDFVNRCFIVNGNENMMKFDGTDVWKCGVPVPTTAPSGVAGADGDLSEGDYRFKVTFVDAEGNEGNPSEYSAVISVVADQKITVTVPLYSGSDYNIIKRRIYRTLADGASYYLDKELDDNTTTEYDSTQADILLSTQNSLEYYHELDHNLPPDAPHQITKRGGRIMLAVGENLYFSKRYYEHFPPAFFIGVGNMSKISGIGNQLHVLQVATKKSVERLLGTSARIESSDYFQFRDSYSSKGCYAPRTMADCDNYIVFLNKEGLKILNIDRIDDLNKIVNAYLKANLNQAYIDKCNSCFYNGIYMLSYPKGTSTVPNETVWIDFRDGSYGIYDFAFNVYSIWDDGGEDSLKAASTTTGQIYTLSEGLEDDGAAIEAYDTVGPLSFGNPDVYKQFYDIYVKVKSTTGTSLRLYYQLDNAAETYKDLTLTANKTLWYRLRLAGGGQRARELHFRPRISDKYYFEIQGYQIVLESEPPEWKDE